MGKQRRRNWIPTELESSQRFFIINSKFNIRQDVSLLVMVSCLDNSQVFEVCSNFYLGLIASEILTEGKPVRAESKELMKVITSRIKGRAKAVFIGNLTEDLLQARICLEKREGERQLIDGASDAIIFAIGNDIPILTSPGVFYEREKRLISRLEQHELNQRLVEKLEQEQSIDISIEEEPSGEERPAENSPKNTSSSKSKESPIEVEIRQLKQVMRKAVEKENYERAAEIRDQIEEIKKER